MTALLSLLSGGSGYLIGAGAVIIAFLATYVRGRLSGAKLERAKRDAEKLRSAEDRLEMDREATAFERRAAQLSDEEARKEATKWAKPR